MNSTLSFSTEFDDPPATRKELRSVVQTVANHLKTIMLPVHEKLEELDGDIRGKATSDDITILEDSIGQLRAEVALLTASIDEIKSYVIPTFGDDDK